MSEGPEPRTPLQGSLLPGVRVEVRTGYDRSWVPGFSVEEVADRGYRLRRRSDNEVLPVTFPFDDVRRERRSAMWRQ
ncbi:MAG: hypothetical protein JWN46_1870 [Acidimicrobiales bacterium]|nr:hypothetical protein [Acidimicrobiales bacterium]